MRRHRLRRPSTDWLRRWALVATLTSILALAAACSGDAAVTDAADAPDDTTGADQQGKDGTSGADVAAEAFEDIHGQGVSGCVACHTDKDRLKELAPEEPEEEEEGGGG
jgi:hypothetical protein